MEGPDSNKNPMSMLSQNYFIRLNQCCLLHFSLLRGNDMHGEYERLSDKCVKKM